MRVVEQVLAPERAGDGQCQLVGDLRQQSAVFCGPSASARDEQGPARRPQQRSGVFDLALGTVGGRVPTRTPVVGRCRRRVEQHVLGKRDDARATPAGHRAREGLPYQFGHPVRTLDLRDPLGERPEHQAVVDFLEGFAIELVARHLSDEEDDRRGVLEGSVHADGPVAGTRPPGDEGDAGPPGQLGIGLGHEGRTALVAAGDDANAILDVVECVEDRQIALTGDAEDSVDVVSQECIDDQLAASPCRGVRLHQFAPDVRRYPGTGRRRSAGSAR
jgi:hypothetical protein